MSKFGTRMFVEPAEPTFEPKRGDTKPTLPLAAAGTPFSRKKNKIPMKMVALAFVEDRLKAQKAVEDHAHKIAPVSKSFELTPILSLGVSPLSSSR